MELALYQYCQYADQSLNELPMKALWCEQPPEVGERISMGMEDRWEVVKVYSYRPAAIGQPVRAIHLVQIAREDLPVPPESEWSAYEMQQSSPDQVFYATVEDVGGEVLEMGFNFVGDSPEIGSRLHSYEPVGEGTRMRAIPKNWWVDRFDIYLSREPSPYRTAYLAYCKAAPVTVESEV